MDGKELQTELLEIRSLMDRSTKFIPLSGFSGILAGLYAIAGSALLGRLFRQYGLDAVGSDRGQVNIPKTLVLQAALIAITVLVLSVCTGIWLTVRKAVKRGENIFDPNRRTLVNRMAAPLVCGGMLMIISVFHGEFGNIAAYSLLFYGLALLAGSYYTVSLLKYLGYLQLILGLLAAMFPAYGFYCWILGFGVLHIVYGSIMHFKYER